MSMNISPVRFPDNNDPVVAIRMFTGLIIIVITG